MNYVGKKGFISVAQRREPKRSLNLIQLSTLLDTLIEEKKVQFENELPVIDLQALGFGKLLGSGSMSRAVRVRVSSCSERALKKLRDAGGEAILSSTT
jgi:large subunit ribosomal protein L15